MKELTHYRMKDDTMSPLYKKGDNLGLIKADSIGYGSICVVQSRVKIFVGRMLPSRKIGYLEMTNGLNENVHRFISIGRKKFNFYVITGKI